MQFAVAFRVLGLLLMVFSLTMLPPIGVSLWYDDGNLVAFVDTLLVTLLGGLLIWLPARHARRDLRTRDGFFVVTLMWAGMSAFAAIPFMLTPALSASYTDAYFEAMSGLTTTGASAFYGLDTLPKSLLYYRQQLQWLGGMGIIVLAVAIMPMLGIGGMQLFRAEATGPMKDSKLTPRIAETAKTLWLLYVALTFIGFVAYYAAGMTPFDALGHAFSSAATGGFSTYDASLGHFNSLPIELIAIALMWFGSVSFALHFVALRNIHRGHVSLGAYLKDPEFRFYNGFLLAIIALVTLGLWWHGAYGTGAEALRHAAFQTVSLVTSTGYLTQDYAAWPSFVPWLLLFAFFFGGCAGSTSGGMKAMRILLLVRQSLREFQRLTHPNGVFLVKLGRQPVGENVVEAVWGFVSLYLFVTLVLSLLLVAAGVEYDIAFSAIAASINNTGPGLGPLSSNVSSMDDPVVWIMSFAMLVGRLEVFTVLILFTPVFWRR